MELSENHSIYPGFFSPKNILQKHFKNKMVDRLVMLFDQKRYFEISISFRSKKTEGFGPETNGAYLWSLVPIPTRKTQKTYEVWHPLWWGKHIFSSLYLSFASFHMIMAERVEIRSFTCLKYIIGYESILEYSIKILFCFMNHSPFGKQLYLLFLQSQNWVRKYTHTTQHNTIYKLPSSSS